MVEPERSSQTEQVITPDFLAKLEQLRLVSRKVFFGRLKGERRSRRKGTSVEFADYRDYARGDDLRFLDWNIYGRLDRLFTKLFYEEEDLHVYILLDGSRSMDYGEPNKFLHARRLAAALAYIALVGMDRVAIAAFSADEFEWLRPVRGPGQIRKVFRFLEGLGARGETSLEAGALRFRVRQLHPGIILLASDFFDPAGYEEGLRVLAQGDNDVFAVQVLAPAEVQPDMVGALKLLDMETGEHVEVTVTAELIQSYQKRLAAYREGVAQFCMPRGMHHLVTTTDEDLVTLISHSLRRIGLVR